MAVEISVFFGRHKIFLILIFVPKFLKFLKFDGVPLIDENEYSTIHKVIARDGSGDGMTLILLTIE